MASREKLLEAAARVYAEAGFRGSTTRRIAEEAGVNEVTIFRLFGSKAALLAEALRLHAPGNVAGRLPVIPQNPEAELTEWASAQLAFMRDHRSLIRKSLAEVEEIPETGALTCDGCAQAFGDLHEYVHRLTVQYGTTPTVDPSAVAAMFNAVIFADAIGRDVMPTLFPDPESSAVTKYVRAFLHALGASNADTNGNGRTSGQTYSAFTPYDTTHEEHA